MKYLLPILFLMVLSCQEECNPESTRCQGDQVQICNSKGEWYTVQDCVLVNPGMWECCENAMEYEGEYLTTCVLLDTCESDGGVE
jgi:hypothetical protein